MASSWSEQFLLKEKSVFELIWYYLDLFYLLGSRPKSKIEKIEEITIAPIANVSSPVGRDANLECAISGTLSMENLRVKYDEV